MTEKTQPRKGFIKRTFHFLFGWKTITSPWRKIPKLWHWWKTGSESRWYRMAASPVAILALVALLAGPLLTGYPAVWIGTYFYNYHSVIYPKPIPLTDADKGTAMVTTMVETGKGMTKNWLPNDLVISSGGMPYLGVDNPKNFQLGEVMMYRRVLEEMREHLSRRTTNDYMNTDIVEAYNQFAYSTDKWWLTSTEAMYKDGIQHQEKFLADIKKGEESVYATTYNLDKLLEKMSSGLAGTSRKLEDARMSNIPWYLWFMDFKVDDNYYEAQGNLYVTLQVLHATRIDFHDVLVAKQAVAQMDDLILSIEKSDMYLIDPVIVWNAKPGSFIPFHSGELASLMQTTVRNIDKLRAQLTS